VRRLLVLELVGLGYAELLADERLVTVRRLLDAGIHGELRDDRGSPRPSSVQSVDVHCLNDLPDSDASALMHFVLSPYDWHHFDRELEELLDGLDRDAAILIHASRESEQPFFILAGEGVPAIGEVPGARFSDLAPAILQLAGHEPKARSRLADLLDAPVQAGFTDEEAEAIVRERLSGLGYIG
jgi:hypothetical protein